MNNVDVSYKSISLLKMKLETFFKSEVVIPDVALPNKIHTMNVPVVLMGSFYERIFQLKYWPDNDFELYCLSPEVKKILINVFGFKHEQIGHISRYELFPVDDSSLQAFVINQSTHFYHAGRVSAQKNIEFLIFVIFHLQFLYSPDIQITLIGDFDNEYHKDILGCNYVDYRKKITKLITDLPWPGIPPVIIEGLSQEEWISQIPNNGIFFSASSLLSEDFSVSCAQLQTLGRAILVPRWGGFKDVSGINIKHFESKFVGTSHESISSISKKAKVFAENIITGTFCEFNPSRGHTFFPTQKINKELLANLIVENLERYGSEINLLINNDLAGFASSTIGQKILEECRNSFSKV